MARYRGALCRICRREEQKLFLKGQRCYTNKCAVQKERKTPGQHKTANQKFSDYGQQLREKQKAKRIYGLLEKQFKRFFEIAEKSNGVTGENLIKLLERRLDNVVFKMGFASSCIAARQLIRHGHILVNNKKVNIPSYLVNIGNSVEVKDKSKQLKVIQENLEIMKNREIPSWLQVEKEKLRGEIIKMPTKEEIPSLFNEQLIVEFYSK